MFARYCAVEAVQGVGVPAPKSSFSTIKGVAQPPLAETAFRYSFSAAVWMVAGSAGAGGPPTRFVSLRSKA